jgi:hypothetical protein
MTTIFCLELRFKELEVYLQPIFVSPEKAGSLEGDELDFLAVSAGITLGNVTMNL